MTDSYHGIICSQELIIVFLVSLDARNGVEYNLASKMLK